MQNDNMRLSILPVLIVTVNKHKKKSKNSKASEQEYEPSTSDMMWLQKYHFCINACEPCI